MSEMVASFVRPGVSVVKRVIYCPWLYFMAVIAWALMCVLTRLFARFEVRGKERMPWTGNILYLIRHRNGTVGTFGVQGQLWFPKLFWNPEMYPYNVAKKRHLWFLGPLAPLLRILLLPEKGENNQGREKIFELEREILSRPQVALSLFPTGTRDKVGETVFPRYHSSTAMGRLIRATKPTVVFVYDDDSHRFTKRWLDLKSGRFLFQPLGQLFRRPRVVVTVSKPVDMSKMDTNLGRMCHDTNVTAEALTKELWNLHARWAHLVDPNMDFPKDVIPGYVQSEDFDKMYDGEAY